jgi:hypothetical protein
VDASLNLKPSFSQVDASLNLKSAVTYVDASLNLKPSFSQVDASLNLKPSFSQVDASLNLKSDITYVDASLNLKASLASPTFTGTPNAPTADYDNSSNQIATTGFVQGRISSIINSAPAALDTLNELAAALGNDANFAATVTNSLSQKANITDVNTSLALKPSFSQVDASLILKPSFAQIDASLNLKPTFAQVDASLNAIINSSQIDASLNLKPSFSQVDASLNLKPSFSQVDASLNLKPSFSQIDASLNLKSAVTYVDASLNLKASLASPTFTGTPNAPTAAYDNSSNQIATTGFVQGRISSIINSAPAALDTLNELAAALGNDANFAATVTNSLSQKANATDVNNALALKPSFSQVDASLNLKPSFSQVDASLNTKADLTYVDASLNLKSSVTYVDASLNLKAAVTYVDASLNLKPSFSQVDASLNLKSAVTYVDASLNLKAAIASPTFTGIPNAPTAAYDNSSNQIATTGFVQGRISSIINSAPAALDTLNELAAALGNDANYAATITNSLSQKANTTDVNSALALKPSFAQVDASLNAILNVAQVDASLNLKPNFSQVDVSLNLKPSFSQVDVSLNLKPSFSQVDASLNLKSDRTYVDASLNLKSAVTYVDASLNLKPSFSQVDASLNVKANLASPALTGVPTAPTATAGTNTTQLATTAFVTTAVSTKADLASATFTGNVIVNSLTVGRGGGNVSTNSAFGASALLSNTTGFANAAMGYEALRNNTTGIYNSAVGFNTLKNNTTGVLNSGSGYLALITNTTGGRNSAFGSTALYNNNGDSNSAFGDRALEYNTTGAKNNAFGAESLYYNTTGIENTAIGDAAGFFNKTGTYNTFLGANTDVDSSANTWTSSTAIGANAKITASNQITLGVAATTVRIPGKLSIVGDASFNGRVDICGNFYANYPASSIPSSAIIGGVGGGGGGSFDPNTDLSLNQKLAVGGDVSLNSNVDICGNLKIGKQIPFTVDPSGQWSQLGSSINGESAPEWFGAGDGVDMNADGTIIIIGGNRYSSNTGRAVVYKYINSAWTQLGQTIVGSGTNVYCGAYTAINAAGDIIAVSSTYTDVTYTDSGSVTVYKYNTGSSLWVQLGQTLNGPAINAHFGNEIELNADGYTIVIGNADLNQCFVYRYNGTSTWNQLGNTIAGATGDVIGLTVDINEAGNIVALGTLPTTIKIYSLVGSTWTILGNVITTGAATGRYDKLALSSDGYTVIAGDEANNAALVYKYNGTTWVQHGQKILGPDTIGGFGGDVAINSDGTIVAAGSRMSVSAKGQAFAYWYNGSAWVQLGQTINGIATGDRCGETVSLSKSGTVFAVGSSLYGGGLGQVRIFSIPYTAAVSSGKLAVNCDASFVGRVDIIGNTTLSTVTASKLALTSDASFSGRVDVCGNFYAKYPASSIPASAIIGGVGGGSAFATDICVNSITIGRGGGNSNFSNAVGINALGRNTTGGMNVAVGTNSLFSNLTGENNVAMNFGALYANTSGVDNVAIGKQAITTNQTGSNNVGIGSLAIQGITSSNNTAVGYRSLVYSSTGSSNTAFGYLAGGNNSTGSFNTYIGYGADVPAFGATWSNSTAIGANAMITASNQITLGTAAERVFMPGKLTTTGDASFNGRVDINGNVILSNATASKMRVTSDASFNGRVDICGNFYAQYPASSIPQSAIIGGVGGGSSVVDLTTSQTISGTKTFSNQINIGTNSLIPLATLAVAQLGTNLLGPGTSFAGSATALNDAGTIVAVGCSAHSNFRGAVRVYQWSGSTWTQLGNDILSTSDNTQLGNAVSLSANGLILAAGGYQANLVRVFQYANSAWTQLGSDITNIGPHAGTSVSLSADGLTVAIGAPRDYTVGENSGKTRICKYINGTWTQLGQDIVGEAMQNYAGCSVALSADGTIVVIGANYNDGLLNGTTRYMSGHARIYKYANSTWTQLGQDIDGENNYDMSGWGVAISDDGTIVAIGAPYNAPGGHVRVYKYANSTWTKLGQDIDGRSGSGSGNMVALSADGYTVAIGSQYATGLGGQSNQGYAVVYKYNGTTWSMVGSYIEGQAAGDQFGYSVALSSDGTILSGGSPYNNSSTGNVKVYKIQTASSKVIVSDGVDICGNLYANTLQLSSSATFNGRVDICGNFYAQYPPNSIPASAIIGGVGSSVSSSGSSGSSTGANVTFTDSFALIKEAVVVDPAATLLRQF